ncbi:MAG: hypothetical protein F6K30_28160 [Cyanothece sp. SIO2G6]|nr:hypothetical protein [Cyanothece sp. SIO2G6]
MGEPEILNGCEALPYGVQRRLDVLKRLERCKGTAGYAVEESRALQELKLSRPTLKRLIRQCDRPCRLG